ncbi:MAG: hypothetical protein JST01_04185 [Cyanobacteria bacterium SZAS TMP-1]|nr:hypothetical protein [Cyanobacteria bacterium SZAS TMP-1]
MTQETGSAEKPSQEIIVAIFGRWANTAEIAARLADSSCRNFCQGRTLINKQFGRVIYDLEIRERDPALSSSVISCGAGRLSPREIDAVHEHTHYVVLTGPVSAVVSHVQSQVEAALDMLNTVAALIQDLSGDVVHVATAGISHTLESWVDMNNQCNESATVNAFVQRIGGGGVFFSCGMHAFGYADARLTEDLPPAEGAKVLFEFLLHSLTTGLNNQGSPFVFQSQSVEGGFRATIGQCTEWRKDSALYNRFGVWNLVRV